MQANIQRLETGLTKLRKTQGDVDVLVEQARVMSLEVEQKVSAANQFADTVSAALGDCWIVMTKKSSVVPKCACLQSASGRAGREGGSS